jgi:uncharacterized protein YecE (DUF72 family)
MTPRVRIGCSGWNYDHWRNGVFYPARLTPSAWLAYSADRFDTVEVNASFYRLPLRRTVERWASSTPPSFTFAVKVSRYLTHVKRLRDTAAHLPRLLERLEPLIDSPKLGPLLWQLPPSFRRDDDRLVEALEAFPRELRHAIEFRHESWFADDVLALLRARGVALVVADGPNVRAFQRYDRTADFVYVRLHRSARTRTGNYSRGELVSWAERIGSWASEGDVYVYFNNDWEGFAPANASALASLLGRPERLQVRRGGAGLGRVPTKR